MRKFLSQQQEKEIVEAIGRAEQGNRGEVRVHIEKRCPGDSIARARQLFGELGMAETTADTGVLLYIAHGSKKAAIWAGAGIHQAVAREAWQSVIDGIAQEHRVGNGVGGVCNAVDIIGTILRQHLPGTDQAGDELPNQVTTS